MKRALGINAVFSGFTGIVLIIFHRMLATIFQLRVSTIFWVVGLALIFFAGTILYEIRKLNKPRIVWIIVQDMLWVVGSIYMLVAQPFSISESGNYIIAIVALIVFLMAINQLIALLKAHNFELWPKGNVKLRFENSYKGYRTLGKLLKVSRKKIKKT